MLFKKIIDGIPQIPEGDVRPDLNATYIFMDEHRVKFLTDSVSVAPTTCVCLDCGILIDQFDGKIDIFESEEVWKNTKSYDVEKVALFTNRGPKKDGRKFNGKFPQCKRMRLWLLKNKMPGWDQMIGIVVRAESEDKARKLASTKAYGEGWDVWLSRTKSSCIQIMNEGNEEIILDSISG